MWYKLFSTVDCPYSFDNFWREFSESASFESSTILEDVSAWMKIETFLNCCFLKKKKRSLFKYYKKKIETCTVYKSSEIIFLNNYRGHRNVLLFNSLMLYSVKLSQLIITYFIHSFNKYCNLFDKSLY